VIHPYGLSKGMAYNSFMPIYLREKGPFDSNEFFFPKLKASLSNAEIWQYSTSKITLLCRLKIRLHVGYVLANYEL